jgi:hypothetical protein
MRIGAAVWRLVGVFHLTRDPPATWDCRIATPGIGWRSEQGGTAIAPIPTPRSRAGREAIAIPASIAAAGRRSAKYLLRPGFFTK